MTHASDVLKAVCISLCSSLCVSVRQKLSEMVSGNKQGNGTFCFSLVLSSSVVFAACNSNSPREETEGSGEVDVCTFIEDTNLSYVSIQRRASAKAEVPGFFQ